MFVGGRGFVLCAMMQWELLYFTAVHTAPLLCFRFGVQEADDTLTRFFEGGFGHAYNTKYM